MRACLLLLLPLLAACAFPEAARAPDRRLGPAPTLVPIGPLVADPLAPDRAAERALRSRGQAARTSALAIPTGEAAAARLEARAEASRAAAAPDDEEEESEADLLKARADALRERLMPAAEDDAEAASPAGEEDTEAARLEARAAALRERAATIHGDGVPADEGYAQRLDARAAALRKRAALQHDGAVPAAEESEAARLEARAAALRKRAAELLERAGDD